MLNITLLTSRSMISTEAMDGYADWTNYFTWLFPGWNTEKNATWMVWSLSQNRTIHTAILCFSGANGEIHGLFRSGYSLQGIFKISDTTLPPCLSCKTNFPPVIPASLTVFIMFPKAPEVTSRLTGGLFSLSFFLTFQSKVYCIS